MMQYPRIVIGSLGAITVTGLFFAVAAAMGGAPAAGALFLLLPGSVVACTRAIRYSRSVVVGTVIGATLPLVVGVAVTWPDVPAAAPYLIGIVALWCGLSGLLSHTGRAWYASLRARRLIGLIW